MGEVMFFIICSGVVNRKIINVRTNIIVHLDLFIYIKHVQAEINSELEYAKNVSKAFDNVKESIRDKKSERLPYRTWSMSINRLT